MFCSGSDAVHSRTVRMGSHIWIRMISKSFCAHRNQKHTLHWHWHGRERWNRKSKPNSPFWLLRTYVLSDSAHVTFNSSLIEQWIWWLLSPLLSHNWTKFVLNSQLNYFKRHFLTFLRLKFKTISLEITWSNFAINAIALGSLVLDRWKPNYWKLGESQIHGTGTKGQ